MHPTALFTRSTRHLDSYISMAMGSPCFSIPEADSKVIFIMRSFLSSIFKSEPALLLGRWARKGVRDQLKADVHDPGYDQMHWSVFPPGQARQEAIRKHYETIDKRVKR